MPAHRATATDLHPATNGATAGAKARRERDRFVAFAHAAADLLVELDGAGRIVFVGGASRILLGCTESELLGEALVDRVASADRAMLARVLERSRNGARIDHLTVRFSHARRPATPLVLRGYRLPDLDDHIFLALRMPTSQAHDTKESARDPETGLLQADSFAEAAAAAVQRAGTAGEAVKLTLLLLGAIDELKARLDHEKRAALDGALAAIVRAVSVSGDLASQLESDRIGLVHRADTDLERLRTEILETARLADPAGAGVTLTAATMALDDSGLDPQQMARVLKHTIDRFCANPEAASARSLSEGLTLMTTETVDRMRALSATLVAEHFTLVYQPICELATLRPHHFEALIRFNQVAGGLSTFEAIPFAEDVGLILDLDLAVCRRVLAEIKARNSTGYRYLIAANLSAQSLSNPRFVAELMRLVESSPEQRKQLIFEVTESAKVQDLSALNAALQCLRGAGHTICLDDLGAGEAAFRYLGQLDVDVAKIDGQFVRGSIHSPKGRALLKAMASVCRDLGIMSIGEMIEDEAHARIALEAGLAYGQGYLFGKPAKDLSSFESPRPNEFARTPGR